MLPTVLGTLHKHYFVFVNNYLGPLQVREMDPLEFLAQN